MFPLVPGELAADFDLGRVLRFGSLPLVWQAEDPVATLDACVQLYLREEIRAEALVRNVPAFLRFLPVAALFHGQTINVASLARDAEVDFLLRQGREYVAIEVKAQRRFSSRQLLGLRAIADLPRVVRRVLVHPGDRPLRTDDGIEILPLEAFFDQVAGGALWPWRRSKAGGRPILAVIKNNGCGP